jgi:Trk K+ transport system NAD-binding subunit
MKRLSRSTHFSMGAFSQIMKFARGYGIAELLVSDSDLLAGKTLAESGLSSSDILVLAIRRKHQMITTPKAGEIIKPDDKLVCFGPLANIASAIGHEPDGTG